MNDTGVRLPNPSTAASSGGPGNLDTGSLLLSDLTRAGASCSASDPGPDPSYDPDRIPDEADAPSAA